MNKQPITPEHVVLDEYEQAIEDTFEQGIDYPAHVVRAKMKQAKEAAAHYIKTKDKRISIRVYGEDLERLKEIAKEEGLPYQTLITSVLHKFSTGLLTTSKIRHA